jgi:alkylation response protein AidB-like acyl-CoA dehydrogenase
VAAVRHATVPMCAVVAGTRGAAVELTAEYAKNREAFQRLLATFQAVWPSLAVTFYTLTNDRIFSSRVGRVTLTPAW